MRGGTVAGLILLLLTGLRLGSAAAAGTCASVKLVCTGFEPNWQFVTQPQGDDTVVSFADPENPAAKTPLIARGCLSVEGTDELDLVTEAPLSLQAHIEIGVCTLPSGGTALLPMSISFVQGAVSDHPRRVQGHGCCYPAGAD